MSNAAGKLIFKAGNGSGFKIEGDKDYFNADGDTIKEVLKNIELGSTVTLTFEKKGIARKVSKIEVGNEPVTPVETPASSTKPDTTQKPTTYNKVGGYGSAEDVAGKQVGCAAGVAATLLQGIARDLLIADNKNMPKVMELWRLATNEILEHIRALK